MSFGLGLSRCSARDGRWRSSRRWFHVGITPEVGEVAKRAASSCLGRSLGDIDAMELIKVS